MEPEIDHTKIHHNQLGQLGWISLIYKSGNAITVFWHCAFIVKILFIYGAILVSLSILFVCGVPNTSWLNINHCSYNDFGFVSHSTVATVPKVFFFFFFLPPIIGLCFFFPCKYLCKLVHILLY